MKTPEERYNSDPKFKSLVDTLTAFVFRAEYTPSEVREAALLACIHYEHSRIRNLYIHKDMYDFSELQPMRRKEQG